VIVLDASVLIAFYSAKDAHHQAALRLFGTDGHFAAASLTVAEVLAGQVRSGNVEQVMSELTEVMGITVLADAGENWPQLLATTRATHRLKMPDAVVLATTIREGAAVATFDARLAAAARAQGLLHPW